MKILLKYLTYIIVNLHRIIIAFLVSAIFTFLVYPILEDYIKPEHLLSSYPPEIYIGVLAFILLILIFLWKISGILFKKLRSNFKLEQPPFIYLDYVIYFIFFSFILASYFQNIKLPALSVNNAIFLYINLIILIIWFISVYFYKDLKGVFIHLNLAIKNMLKKEASKKEGAFHFSDDPIQYDNEDLLARENFVNGFYEEITKLPFENSFVYGLYGGWGEGKTSVINLLKNKLQNNEKLLLIDYNPWHYQDEKAILTAFYEQIEQKISEEFVLPDLRKYFKKYQKIISCGVSITGIKLDLPLFSESFKVIFTRLQSYINLINKKIIIFIDDLDRITFDEILLVLKLVRHNTKFKNTIFILSFDPIIIKDKFQNKDITFSDFIDKIIQKPIQLPAVEQYNIDNFLNGNLFKILEDLKIPENIIQKFKNDIHFKYYTNIFQYFGTLRRAKRFLNGLASSLPAIKEEVNLYDFFILELIRIFHPGIYNDIAENPWYYIPVEWEYGLHLISPFRFMDEGKKYQLIKEHIEKLIIEEKNKNILLDLLKSIFLEADTAFKSLGFASYNHLAKDYRKDKRISHIECFRKYFMLQVPHLEFSDNFVEITINLWNSGEKRNKKEMIDRIFQEVKNTNRLSEFFKKLFLFIEKIQEETAIELIEFIYNNAEHFSKKNRPDSEFDEAKWLLLRLINDKIEKEKIQNILEEVVLKTTDFSFAVSVVLSCKREQGGLKNNIYDTVNNDELQRIVSEHLKRYFIDDKKDIFNEIEEPEWVFILYQWASNWMTFTGDNNKVVTNYILSIFRNSPVKFSKYIFYRFDRVFDPAWEFKEEDFIKLHGHVLNEFCELAEKYKTSNEIGINEKKSLKLFLNYCDKK